MDRYSIDGEEAAVLPNKLGINDVAIINQEEFIGFSKARQNAIDNLDVDTVFDLAYLFSLHFDALGHLYEIAGKVRQVNSSKDGFMFPAAQFLPGILQDFEREYLLPVNEHDWSTQEEFLDLLAIMHAEVLYIHPFREGNGRVVRLFTQLIYLAKKGEEFELDLLNESNNFQRYVAAVQQAAEQKYNLMRELFRELGT